MNDNNNPSVLKKCIDFIQHRKRDIKGEDSPSTEGDDGISYDIAEERIFSIPICDESRKLAFVDGGTASILSAADFSISLDRVAGVLFEGNKIKSFKKIPEVIEFYTATILEPMTDGKLAYNIQLFPREPRFKEFLPDEEIIIPLNEVMELMGRMMPRIEIFGGVAMRFVEWTYATKLIEYELDKGDIFIRDGSLQTGYKDEILLVRELHSMAEDKSVYITGLSKTCRMITKSGDSLISLVDMMASKKYPDEQWYYHPIYRMTKADNLADVYFVKLHKFARSPFRFDIYLDQSENLEQQEKEVIISNLAANSTDLSFPGYPYGLIKVDQLSRVAKREIGPQKIQLMAEFDSGLYEKYILPRIRSIDAHDLLNTIRKN